MEKLTGKKEQSALPETEVLTVGETKLLLFQSFRFSQGGPGVQKNLLTLIHAQHPEVKLPDPDAMQGQQTVGEIIDDYVITMGVQLVKNYMHPDVENATITTEAIRIRTQMYSIFSSPSGDIDELTRQVFRGIVKGDYRYLHNESGRDHLHPKSDSWASDFMTYIANKKPPSTGNSLFDDVFAALRQYYKSQKWKEETLLTYDHVIPADPPLADQVEDIIRIYQDKHPKTPIENFLHF